MNYLELVAKVDTLNEQYKDTDSLALLKFLEDEFPTLTLVSSFGAESAVLLHMVSLVNVDIPVVLVDTGKLFKQTLEYKETLEKHFSLKNVKVYKPKSDLLNEHDPQENIHEDDPDLCCFVRKVEPLLRALKNTNIWISGRKRFQSSDRSKLPLFELDGMRIKVNPLANWTQSNIKTYFTENDLPEHPLLKDNYFSIGCMPCTTAVKDGEGQRSGRWRGQVKSECGIHKNSASVN